ncbi:ABC transporter permease [Pseudonocardia eucalypti]|uniref:ABC transporter permease n=1 Tax=Pseudonocardia eucalypti TaxID=648755 RepID=A0ABP9RD01_9PSEU|nr:putative ABC transport system permease protein [Pseudonocardia eucalypti]
MLAGTPLPGSPGKPRTADGERLVAAGRRTVEALATEWVPQMREAVAAAAHSLSNNRLRALLTTTGIVVGVAAVIVLVALGDGMRANFDAQFSRLSNQAIITTAKGSVPNGREPRKLTDQDVDALTDPQHAPHIAAVSPAIQGNVVVTAGQAKDNASLVGATENYLEMQNRRVVAGTWFSKDDVTGSSRHVVLGQQAVRLLYGSEISPQELVGKPIRLAQSTFKIQGVLAADGQNDNSVLVPLTAARAYLVGNKGGEVSQVTLRSTSVDTLQTAVAEATKILDTEHYIREPTGRDFNITTFTELLNQSTQFLDFLTMFIVAVAAISLFVGGVGVANIMLVSVTERTREIGIRKAVGAKTTAILRQFLSEAVILTGLGGAVGAILGVAVTLAAGATLPDLIPQVPTPILSAGPVVIAFLVSLAIGLLAGGYPARRAARLRPIEALRFE